MSAIIASTFQGRDEFIYPDGLIAVWSGGNHRDLRRRFLLQELQILLRFGRKLVMFGDAFSAGLPSVELAIDWLDLLEPSILRGNLFRLFAVDLVTDADRDLC